MILAFLVCWLTCSPALADDDRHGGGDDLAVATSLVTGDNRTIALSQGSLGDVDIFGCLGSSQFSIFIFFAKQKLEIDPLCVADEYDQAGKHNLAAQMRCKVPLVSELDYTGTNCIEANTFSAPPPPPEPTGAQSAPREDPEEHQEHVVAQQLEYAALAKRLDQVEATRRANARASKQRAQEDADYLQSVQQQLAIIDQEPEQ
jgi:hypothetical protein